MPPYLGKTRFHRKMKLIQRRAYGFRNFENYRLRVRVLCA
ncbi:transposase [Legionella pneumophila]